MNSPDVAQLSDEILALIDAAIAAPEDWGLHQRILAEFESTQQAQYALFSHGVAIQDTADPDYLVQLTDLIVRLRPPGREP